MTTHLARQDVERCAAAFGVGSVKDFAVVEAGTINSNYRLDTERGRYFLRVNEGKTDRQVRYEFELTSELGRRGVPMPLPISAGGEAFFVVADRYVSLFPWIVGHHETPATLSPADASRIGRSLAELHLAGLEVKERFAEPGIYTWPKVTARLDGFRGSSDPDLVNALRLLDAEVKYLNSHAARRAAQPTGIIHGDLFPDNVIFSDGGAYLLDFEQASTGSLVYDLAVCLNAWCYRDEFVEELLQAMALGYHEKRALAPNERADLYLELRATAVRFTITRITDVYLSGKNRPGKDFRRFLQRLLAWQQRDAASVKAWF